MNQETNEIPSRPLARYPGSKNRIASWILSYLPDGHDTYVLPYGGMAATLFHKSRVGMEVYNDINGDVINLFQVIRDNPDELIHGIRFTCWSPVELERAQEPTDDPIERARRFFVNLWMSHYPFDDRPSFRRQYVYSRGASGKSSMVPGAVLFSDIDYLYTVAERLRGVVIENLDALELISRYDYDKALIYCDPPYVHETRSRKNHYAAEMSVDQHKALAAVLGKVEGMAAISGYASNLYTDLYEDALGWHRADRTVRTNGRDKVESLWLSPNLLYALENQAKSPKQLGLL